MSSFLRNMHSEFYKILFSKATKIVLFLVLLLQSAFAYIYGKQLLQVGLDATPETYSGLAEAIPPMRYLGFDVILIGLMPMIFFGAFFGAKEYKHHSIRTTLLANGRKSVIFFSKLTVFGLITFVLSFVSVFTAIATTHIALGIKGLNPVILSPTIWQEIMLGTYSWTALTVLSFLIGFLFRTSIVPLLFLVPQVYNIGSILAEKFEFCKYLPFALGDGLIATSPSTFSDSPIKNALLLLVWLTAIGIPAYLRFYHSDLGGNH